MKHNAVHRTFNTTRHAQLDFTSNPGIWWHGSWSGWWLALLLQWLQVQALGGDWTGLVNTGRQSALRPLIEAELGPVSTVEQAGHDGQFSYLIAVDPLGRGEAPQLFDHGAYRYRRILLPALAGGFGCLGRGRSLGRSDRMVRHRNGSGHSGRRRPGCLIRNPTLGGRRSPCQSGCLVVCPAPHPGRARPRFGTDRRGVVESASSSLGLGRSGPGGPRQGPIPVGGVWAGRVGVVPGESTGGGPGCRRGCRSAGDLVDLADGLNGRRAHSAWQLLSAYRRNH